MKRKSSAESFMDKYEKRNRVFSVEGSGSIGIFRDINVDSFNIKLQVMARSNVEAERKALLLTICNEKRFSSLSSPTILGIRHWIDNNVLYMGRTNFGNESVNNLLSLKNNSFINYCISNNYCNDNNPEKSYEELKNKNNNDHQIYLKFCNRFNVKQYDLYKIVLDYIKDNNNLKIFIYSLNWSFYSDDNIDYEFDEKCLKKSLDIFEILEDSK
jgi:hypothetical protein